MNETTIEITYDFRKQDIRFTSMSIPCMLLVQNEMNRLSIKKK